MVTQTGPQTVAPPSPHHRKRTSPVSPASIPPHRARRATITKNTALSFQRVTHVFPFAISHIHNQYNNLPTFCQKHPGVGVSHQPKIPNPPLTPIESNCFANATSNPFIMIFFRKYPGGGGPANSGKSPRPSATRRLAPPLHLLNSIAKTQ